MFKFSVVALAGTALLAAAPAIAKPGGGGGGPQTTTGQGAGIERMGGPDRTMPDVSRSTSQDRPATTNNGTTQREQSRANSQGPANASPTGVANANENSVLAGGSVAADTLPGLTTGLTVNSSTGTSLGTVSKVVAGSDGSIRMIIVTTSTGETIRVPATSLTISGDVVTIATP
jgi:hypothetical protein